MTVTIDVYDQIEAADRKNSEAFWKKKFCFDVREIFGDIFVFFKF